MAFFTFSAEGGALQQLGEMGAMFTMFNIGLKVGNGGGGGPSGAHGDDAVGPGTKHLTTKKEDTLVMDTKLKIIDILQFILDVRLDYRITCLLSIFKQEFDESERKEKVRKDVRGIDLEGIGAQAEEIFGSRFASSKNFVDIF